ncbi:unnamed protein product [Blepharisma stoltei]|uniref:Cyclic nucleotide-binding domain-containing protein n=1 Tax=Blepharisma stoltei TaxID=1481888 RepID=A0AAU9JPI5_9CILI|nr:unnamed protein product [Blepharisma stoltei]
MLKPKASSIYHQSYLSPLETSELDYLTLEDDSLKSKSPRSENNSQDLHFAITATEFTPRSPSSAKKLWKRAFFKIRIGRAIEKFKKEIMLFGTSNEVFDQDKKFKQNLDKIFQKKVDKEEDFRFKKVEEEEKNIPWYILNPCGRFKRTWNSFLTITLLYTAVIMPYRMAFSDVVFFDVWTSIEISIDLLFMVDVMLNFISGVYSSEEVLHTDLKYIILKYLKGWFIIDVISSVPYTLVDYWTGGDGNSSAHQNNFVKLMRVPRLYKLLRIVRVAKAVKHYKTNDLAEKVQDRLQLNSRVYKLVTFLVSVCLCVHIVGCLWFFFARLNNFSPDTWVVRCNYLDNSADVQYIASIYWAMTTVTTVGYGDISGRTELEQILSMIWMLIGIGFYSFTIGSLSSFLTAIDTKDSILASKLAAIHEFALETGISDDCRNRIRQIIKYNNSKVGTVWSDKHSLFSELPKSLRYEVSATMYNGVVKTLIFFKSQDPAFVVSLMPLLKPLLHKDLEYLWLEGTYPDEIFFITKGRVNFVLEGNEVCYKSFLKGSYVGDIEILTEISVRESNAQACGDSEFLVLSKHDFLDILDDFPDQKRYLTQVARERAVRNSKAKEELITLMQIKKVEGSLKRLEGKGSIFDRQLREVSTVVIRDRLGVIEDTVQTNVNMLDDMKIRVSSIENSIQDLLLLVKPPKIKKKRTALGTIVEKKMSTNFDM